MGQCAGRSAPPQGGRLPLHCHTATVRDQQRLLQERAAPSATRKIPLPPGLAQWHADRPRALPLLSHRDRRKLARSLPAVDGFCAWEATSTAIRARVASAHRDTAGHLFGPFVQSVGTRSLQLAEAVAAVYARTDEPDCLDDVRAGLAVVFQLAISLTAATDSHVRQSALAALTKVVLPADFSRRPALLAEGTAAVCDDDVQAVADFTAAARELEEDLRGPTKPAPQPKAAAARKRTASPGWVKQPNVRARFQAGNGRKGGDAGKGGSRGGGRRSAATPTSSAAK
ncbi:MAG: hypothetical protein GY772_27200 [bacterium]|nr:hypothetical protein [bacterium]